jgi:two-component sensor histidine kinase
MSAFIEPYDTALEPPLPLLRAQSVFSDKPLVEPKRVRAMLGDPVMRELAFGKWSQRRARPAANSAEAFLRRVCEDAVDVRGRERVTFFSLGTNVGDVPSSQLWRLGLIVNEMMLNSLQHAHPTGVALVVDLWCRRDRGKNLLLDLSDDGVGLPMGFDPWRDGAFGFSLMRSLADEIDATLDFSSGPLGLTSRVRVPRD